MSGNISDRPIPRPKRRIADRVVPLPKHVLPRIEVAEAAGDETDGHQKSAPGSFKNVVQGAQLGGNPNASPSSKQARSTEVRESAIQTR
jgi:hypothetical protein